MYVCVFVKERERERKREREKKKKKKKEQLILHYTDLQKGELPYCAEG